MTLYIRCELWLEGDCEYDDYFYIVDDGFNKYYIDMGINKIIPNPLVGKINLKRFWKEVYSISKQASDSCGCIDGTIILNDGKYQADIIIKEPGVFPYTYKEWYDDNNYYHRIIDIDYKEKLNDFLENYECRIL